jgi:hypothetical protein
LMELSTFMSPIFARVAKLVDARDLKSLEGNLVPVQVRPRAPYKIFSSRITGIMHFHIKIHLKDYAVHR